MDHLDTDIDIEDMYCDGPVTHCGYSFINVMATNMYIWVYTAEDPIGTQMFV
jgi:hypothetical protein